MTSARNEPERTILERLQELKANDPSTHQILDQAFIGDLARAFELIQRQEEALEHLANCARRCDADVEAAIASAKKENLNLLEVLDVTECPRCQVEFRRKWPDVRSPAASTLAVPDPGQALADGGPSGRSSPTSRWRFWAVAVALVLGMASAIYLLVATSQPETAEKTHAQEILRLGLEAWRKQRLGTCITNLRRYLAHTSGDARALLVLGQALRYRSHPGDQESAIELFRRAARLALRSDPRLADAARRELAWSLKDGGKMGEAVAIFNDLERKARRDRDRLLLTQMRLARLWLAVDAGRFEEARKLGEESVRMGASLTGEEALEARLDALGSLGWACFLTTWRPGKARPLPADPMLARALQSWQRAVAMVRENEASKNFPRPVANAFGNVASGWLATGVSGVDRARFFALEMLRRTTRMGWRIGIGQARMLLARVEIRKEVPDLAVALRYSQLALSDFRSAGWRIGEAHVRAVLASIHDRRGEREARVRMARGAVRIYKELQATPPPDLEDFLRVARRAPWGALVPSGSQIRAQVEFMAGGP